MFVCISTIAHAAPGGLRPNPLPPDLLQYFRARYVQVDDFLSSSVEVTPDGPLGCITVYGRMRPTVNAGGDTPEARVRSVAMAFIDQEASLLDLTVLSELKEMSIGPGESGQTVIQYVRYIGKYELPGSSIRIDVTPYGAITRLQASLVPVPFDLYSAVKRSTIPRDEAVKVVARDLRRPDSQVVMNDDKYRLIATWRYPCVVWTVTTAEGWLYTVNAFNGMIVSKNCTAISVGPMFGRTPCDR